MFFLTNKLHLSSRSSITGTKNKQMNENIIKGLKTCMHPFICSFLSVMKDHKQTSRWQQKQDFQSMLHHFKFTLWELVTCLHVIRAACIHSCDLRRDGVNRPSDRTAAQYFLLFSASALFGSNTYTKQQYCTLK